MTTRVFPSAGAAASAGAATNGPKAQHNITAIEARTRDELATICRVSDQYPARGSNPGSGNCGASFGGGGAVLAVGGAGSCAEAIAALPITAAPHHAATTAIRTADEAFIENPSCSCNLA